MIRWRADQPAPPVSTKWFLLASWMPIGVAVGERCAAAMVRADGSMVGFASPGKRGSGPWPGPRFWPSVIVMFLIRDLVSARTWLAFIHHIAGVIVGLAAFFAVVIAPAFSVGAAAADAGRLPGLRADAAAGWTGSPGSSGRGSRFLLGSRIPRWPAATRPGTGSGWCRGWQAYAAAGHLGRDRLRAGPASGQPGARAGHLLAWSLAWCWSRCRCTTARCRRGGASSAGTCCAVPAADGAGGWRRLLLVLAAPQVTRGMAAADAALARAAARAAQRRGLTARVAELETSRDRVVDAAEAERRRIERDLHDGAQQRLVALAMELGRAKAKFADDVDAAAELVDRAHDRGQGRADRAARPGARRAPAGAHRPGPGRGAVRAGRPLPGAGRRCRWTCPVRPRPAVEAVAYFVVAEALTNVAKHSRASSAKVVVEGYGYPAR